MDAVLCGAFLRAHRGIYGPYLEEKGPKLCGLFAMSFQVKDQDLVALECFAGREPPRRFANSAAQKIA
jgi:hypothetical protein